MIVLGIKELSCLTKDGLLSLVILACKHNDLNSFNKFLLKEKVWMLYWWHKSFQKFGINAWAFWNFWWIDFLWLPCKTISSFIQSNLAKVFTRIKWNQSFLNKSWLFKPLNITIYKKFCTMDPHVPFWKWDLFIFIYFLKNLKSLKEKNWAFFEKVTRMPLVQRNFFFFFNNLRAQCP